MRDFFNTFFRVTLRLDLFNDIARCDITDHTRGIKRPCVVIPLDRNGIQVKGDKIYLTVSCRPLMWSPKKFKKLRDKVKGITHTVTTYITSRDIDKCMEQGVAYDRDDLIEFREVGMVKDYGVTISEQDKKDGKKPRIPNKAAYIGAVIKYLAGDGKNPYSTRRRNLDKGNGYDMLKKGE